MADFDFDDPRCLYSIQITGIDEIKKMLEPENALGPGCRVRRSPTACAICVRNNDCDRIPLHPNCRCTREAYLAIEE